MRRSRPSLLIAAGLAGLLAGAPAVDAALCVTKRKSLVVRAKCKRKKPANLQGLGTGGPQGSPGAKGASSPRARVLDVGGQFVGWMNAVGDVLVDVGGRRFVARAGTDGFRSEGTIYFEVPGCVGPPLIPFPYLLRLVQVHGTTAYYGDTPVTEHPIKSALIAIPAQSCTSPGSTYDAAKGLCCSPRMTAFDAGAAIPVDLSGFRPPFRVEVER